MIRKSKEIVLGFITALLLGVPTVYAVTVLSTEISYSNTTSGSSETTVQGALDDLYTKAINCRNITVTYNYRENGGTSASKESDRLRYIDTVDLTPTAEKEGYDFLGWNTNKNAIEGLESVEKTSKQITLYAIFKKSTTISLDAKTSEYTGRAITANTATVSDGSASPSISYKYYSDANCSNEITTPIDAGTYYAQAEVAEEVGNSRINTYKGAKSNCVNHIITKKPVTVTWSSENYTYDGGAHTPTVTGSSGISGESLTFGTTGSTNAGDFTSSATITSVTGGRGNTNNYEITNSSQGYNIAKRNITCTSGSDSKTYDGTALTKNSGSCSNVATGEEATLEITGTITSAGETSNVINTVVITKNGNDTTGNYNITKTPGTLTINKAASTITCDNKTYNGNSQTIASCSGGNVGNATQTNAGEYTITCTGDANHNNATNKTCSITARATTCTAGSTTRAYNGSTLTNTTGTCDNLVSGHTATFSNSGSITMPGSTTNTLNSVTISNGSNVTSNYSITQVNGTLKVTGETYTVSFTKDTGVDSIGSTSLSCTTGGDSCSITLPSITASNGYETLGWYSGSTKVGDAGATYTLNSSNNGTTLTAKAEKKVVTYYVNLTKGTGVSSISGSSSVLSCTTGSTSCTVTLPSITASSGYTALGWYSGSTKVGDANGSYTLNSSNNGTTLTAKAQAKYVAWEVVRHGNSYEYCSNYCKRGYLCGYTVIETRCSSSDVQYDAGAGGYCWCKYPSKG